MRIVKLLCTLLAVSIVSLSTDSRAEPFHVGVILPLSGPAANLGTYIRQGIELAYDQMTPAQKALIAVHFEDDQLNPTNSVSAYQKLAQTRKLNAVFVVGSGIGNTIAPIAEKDRRLLVALGASDFNVAKGRKYSFIHWVVSEIEAELLVDELKTRNYKKIALIGQEQEGVLALTKAVRDVLPKYGMQDRFVGEELRLPNDTDFRTYIAKAKRDKVDAFIVMLFPGAISAFAKQIRDANLPAALAGIELFEDASEVKAADGALLNQWYITADQASAQFEKDFQTKYKQVPGWGSANGFDSIRLIVAALEGGANDVEGVVSYLEKLKDYTGASGTYSATGDHRFTLPASVKKVTETGFELIRSGAKAK